MTTADKQEMVRLAERLTPAMRDALDRLGTNKVWADGRSVRALIKRGLAANHGGGTDALIGTFRIDTLTDKGRAVYRALAQGENRG